MTNEKEFRECPECGVCISIINGKVSPHERGLGYIPYRLYHAFARKGGSSVKEQAKANLCKGSGVDFNG